MFLEKICANVVNPVKLSPKLGKKFIGDANAVELAGIIRLTAKKVVFPKISDSSFVKSGKNFIEWFNNKFLGPKFAKGMTPDGKFTNNLRISLNKTGYTLKDFAEYVKDTMVIGKFVDSSHTVGKGLRRISRRQRIFSPEDIKKFLENIKKKGGLGKNLIDTVCKETRVPLKRFINLCLRTIHIKKAITKGLKP